MRTLPNKPPLITLLQHLEHREWCKPWRERMTKAEWKVKWTFFFSFFNRGSKETEENNMTKWLNSSLSWKSLCLNWAQVNQIPNAQVCAEQRLCGLWDLDRKRWWLQDVSRSLRPPVLSSLLLDSTQKWPRIFFKLQRCLSCTMRPIKGSMETWNYLSREP